MNNAIKCFIFNKKLHYADQEIAVVNNINDMKIPSIQFKPVTHKDVGVEVLELQELYNRSATQQKYSALPHRCNFNCFLYITDGVGSHFIDFNHYPVQSSSVIFINKNQIQAFDHVNKPQGKLIIFTDGFLDALLSNMRLSIFSPSHLSNNYSPTFKLTPLLNESCEVFLSEIEKEQDNLEPSSHLLQLMLATLLTKLIDARPKENTQYISESRSKIFLLFIKNIELNFKKTREATQYAKVLNITYKALNQICKLASNQTAKQLIDAHTILEAKRQLAVDNIQIQQLAYAFGFDEVTNFVKYFKKHTLLTPTQFKKFIKG